MAAARKPRGSTAKKRKPTKKQEMDRRWSILMGGLGVLFLALCLIPGEAAWAWLRGNLLFGAFGISGWLLGPLFIYWAVLIGLEKPVLGPIIRCILFLFALSGAALVFGDLVFTGLKLGEVLTVLFEAGRDVHTSGGVISLLFGYTLLALCGRPAANVMMVLLVIVTAMLFTHVSPGDIARFFSGLFGRIPKREKRVYEDDDGYEYEEELDEIAPPPVAKPRRGRKKVDVDLGPDEPVSQPGLAQNDEVEIGPGGTFGMNPLGDKPGLFDEAAPVIDDEPLMPFDPFSKQSLYEGVERPASHTQGAGGGLFGEGAAPVKAASNPFAAPPTPLFEETTPAPRGLFDEPEAETGEDLFGRAGAPALVQFRGKGEGVQMAGEVQASASGAAYDEALFDKAMKGGGEGNEAVADSRPVADMFQPYQYPSIGLFDAAPAGSDAGAREEMKKTADLLVGTLASFGVQTRILDVSRGPSVTRYEVQPQTGVKISRITNLSDDIALNLAAAGVRIEAPIPGKPAVGIEVPNKKKTTVSIRSILESRAFAEATSPLTIALGKDIAGDSVVADLTKMPHLLVAGSTGSGKSVCINSIIMSILYKSAPEDVRIMLIDPKVVELAEYNGIPHLLMPVVTEPRKAAGALGQMVAEMEKRYHTFAENNVRDIKTYNKLAARRGELEKMPYIAIIIDELADLMMTSGKEVEDYICRIAQKARAAGMHLIVATQRPSVDVITGLIKANIPSRIAFAVSSQIDSRTILDGAGAEKLLGMGDMLFMPVGANKPVRVQGTYVKDKEISAVIKNIKQTSGGSRYDEDFIQQVEDRLKSEGSGDAADGDGGNITDPTFVQAVEIALEQGQISTSFLQRRLRLGYARAGRIMDDMQQMGIISAPEGAKPRQVLINRQQWIEMNNNALE